MSYIGHEVIRKELNKIVDAGSISHAYLFLGKEGIGKKLVALDFARKVLGFDDVNVATNSDLKVLTPEKGVIKVDAIRGFTSELFLLPTVSDRKVFIIDEADKMNEQAQNALLKVLEEPPLYATLILVTSNKEKLLRTIKSRVTEIAFDVLSPTELEQIMKENDLEISKDAIEYANGSAKRAIEFVNDDTFEISKKLADTILEQDFLKLNRKFEEVKSDKALKANMEHILENVMHIFFNKLRKGVTFNYELITLLEKTIQKIKRNANVDLAIDVFMLDVCKV